jgi:hypothetical protein
MRVCVCMNQAYGVVVICARQYFHVRMYVSMNQAHDHCHLREAMYSCAYVCVH